MATKIALITGGSRGLGKEMALRMADAGHDVLITYNSQRESADEVVNQIRSRGRMAAALQFDASDFKSIHDFVTAVGKSLESSFASSTFDFLVNNAGMGATIPFMQATEEQFDQFMNVHFKTVFFLTQRLLPKMNDGGRIINLSSGTTRFAMPGYAIYSSMKGAIEVFTRNLAKEIGARGITVNVVAPGPIETDFNNALIRSNPDRKKILSANTALGRVGEAEDIGGVVVFLCSEDARWITGQRIEVSGGINL